MPIGDVQISTFLVFCLATFLQSLSNTNANIFDTRSKRQVENSVALPENTTIQMAITSSSNLAVYVADTCPAVVLSSSRSTAMKILMYVSAGWIVAWCLFSMTTNIVFYELSMQRALEAYQEIGYLVLFIFLGVFTYQTDSHGLCIATTIVILFFLNFVVSIFFVKQLLSTCMIRNIIDEATAFHWSICFGLPIIIATTSTVAGYFSCKNYYGLQTPHCFCFTRTKQFWSFVLPVWIMFLCLNFVSLFAFTMCKLTKLEHSNLTQLYWSFKTSKVTTFLLLWTCTAVFSLMFAVDMQIVWLHIVYFVVTLLLGPIIFVCHTFSHAQTCISLFALTSLPFYQPCPPPLPSIHEEQFGVFFSLRMKIPMNSNQPPEEPALQRRSSRTFVKQKMAEMLVIDTPPIHRNTRIKKQIIERPTIETIEPPPPITFT
ncbi:hypothetical protein M3Y95_00629600 [Aphelenchoides besseyi]|nr:hypothetical protein M3Y95_00629600 [Aphelenchoides besseyi]